jgi:hypothetical protein
MMMLKPMLEPLGCAVAVYQWQNWEVAWEHLSATRLLRRVVIGYSGGGSRATWLANKAPRPIIDLVVTYDPSPTWQMEPLNVNVLRAITYENSMPFAFGLLGKYDLGCGHLTSHGAPPVITRNHINMPHLAVQADMQLHTQTVDAVKALFDEQRR